jgi:hypothetical protein
MSYRKVGGLHFVRIGRFGFAFYFTRRRTKSFNCAQEACLGKLCPRPCGHC